MIISDSIGGYREMTKTLGMINVSSRGRRVVDVGHTARKEFAEYAVSNDVGTIVVALGFNDWGQGSSTVQFSDRYGALIGRLKGVTDKVLCVGPWYVRQKMSVSIDPYICSIAMIADSHGVEFLEMHNAPISDDYYTLEVYNAPDHVHPDGQGVQLFAERIAMHLRALGWQ